MRAVGFINDYCLMIWIVVTLRIGVINWFYYPSPVTVFDNSWLFLRLLGKK
jgi:hypothetical protein